MRSYLISLLAVMALLFTACEKDTVFTGEDDNVQQVLNQADQRIADADALMEQDLFVSERAPGVLPAFSIDGLQDAIQEVGPYGTVFVESGMHFETSPVMITFPVKIVGDEGAIIQSTTAPNADFPYTMEPALFLDHAARVHIEGLTFVPNPETGMGGTAILVSNSDRAMIRDNDFSGYFQAVMVYASDFVRIHYNRAEGLYTEGFDSFNSYGFSVMSGKAAYLRGNFAEDFWAGYFVSDKDGILYKNTATGGVQGYFFCNYGEGALELPDGTSIGAESAATNWLAYSNTAQRLVTGYLIIDGANNNRLVNNKAIDYSLYGFEFAGETTRFGAPALPTSSDNYFLVSGRNITVKDCGLNNEICGGKLVDTTSDPCN